MKQTELAAALDLTKGQVSKLVARGMPTDSIESAQAWRRLNVRPEWSKEMAAPPPATAGASDDPAPTDNENYWRAKARREASLADLAEMELAKARGDLVEAAAVERGLHEASRMLRDMVLSVPNRIAAQVIATGDAGHAQRLMREELRTALEQFERLAHDALARGGC